MTGITMREITQATADAFGFTEKDLTGTSRNRDVCRARFAAMAYCRENGASLSSIGMHFNRDHTSVMNGLKRCQEICESDGDYRFEVNTLHHKMSIFRDTFVDRRECMDLVRRAPQWKLKRVNEFLKDDRLMEVRA